jgi:xanthine dehydrogenase accessory factor
LYGGGFNVKKILSQVEDWQAQGEEVAQATVVRIIGSAPRPLGARMVVSSGGSMAGSVSGGCVEGAVYEEALKVIKSGQPRLVRYGISDDMAWDVGLACGGTIEVFVERLDPQFCRELKQQIEREEPFALVTVVKAEKDVGAKFPVFPGGDAPEAADGRVIGDAQELLSRRASEIRTYSDPELEVFIESFLPPVTLVIVGGVHVGIPLVRFARELGLRTIVVDPRAKFANRERFPEADQVINEWPDEALSRLKIGRSSAIVLLTHDPKIDEPALASALETGAFYIGAIGSRKTQAERLERMAKLGVDAERLRRVYAPIGLDIGGGSAEEIALSIIAEVVAVKNGRPGASLRQGRGPIQVAHETGTPSRS